VASACATNPVALAIPCHRVLQKGGALAGYRWGLPRKAALLDNEVQHARRNLDASSRQTPGSADNDRADTVTTTKLDHAA
jgi:AraC family transcriptional regulator of adaptative response/methylated-DNA-[protein]-cysteine methyltransferase